ncbi:Uncharacterised protein [uncultured Anaerotruncus sp.]|uniref:Uncharacterized protein n=1 Tax=uncultured Anaerotruncus sp. TaxID=905011 RepID=A0A6N2UJQ8_9FIRM
MTNNERFNRALNACGDPRRVYMALWALAASPSCLSQLAAYLGQQEAPETGKAGGTCPQAR